MTALTTRSRSWAGYQLAVLMVVAVILGGIGWPADAGAVIGGRHYPSSKVPWLVWLGGCGGSLVTPNRILTAAHCVADRSPAQMTRVRLDGDPKRVLTVTGISTHPGYDWPRYDVALLQLASPVSSVRPVGLARARAGQTLRIVGRGQRTFGGGLPGKLPALYAADLKVISDHRCRQLRRRDREPEQEWTPKTMFCGIDPRHGGRPRRSVCIGDSGGPALVRYRGVWRQAGVSAWVSDRCDHLSGFIDTVALRSFVLNKQLTWAPVAEGKAALSGVPALGNMLRCSSPSWRNHPTKITYTFQSFRWPKGLVTLQSGYSDQYAVGQQDVGRRVECRVRATNAGGYADAYAEIDVPR